MRTAANAIYVKKFEKKNQDFNWIVWASFFQTSLCNFMIVYTAVRIILRLISAVFHQSHSTENIGCSNYTTQFVQGSKRAFYFEFALSLFLSFPLFENQEQLAQKYAWRPQKLQIDCVPAVLSIIDKSAGTCLI